MSGETIPALLRRAGAAGLVAVWGAGECFGRACERFGEALGAPDTDAPAGGALGEENPLMKFVTARMVSDTARWSDRAGAAQPLPTEALPSPVTAWCSRRPSCATVTCKIFATCARV